MGRTGHCGCHSGMASPGVRADSAAHNTHTGGNGLVFLQPETLASATPSRQQFTLSRAEGLDFPSLCILALVSLQNVLSNFPTAIAQWSCTANASCVSQSAGWFSKHPVLAGVDAIEVHCGSFFPQQVLSMIINAAYKPGRVLRELQLVEDPHWNFQEETLKAK